MDKLEQVAYCGLYCGLCSQRNRIPEQARSLRHSMQKEGWDIWGQDQPCFKNFWLFLNRLAESESQCSCRGGECGPPFCEIRKCARNKGLEVCISCDTYPCGLILELTSVYPTLLSDAKRMREKGIEVWIQEQEERRKTGFAYTDIRYLSDEISGD